MNRTHKTTVTFKHPFLLAEFDTAFPAGVYDVETDEELLSGLSFEAYRRTASRIHIPADPAHRGMSYTLTIDPHEVDLALERDKATQTASPKTLEPS